MAKKKVNTILNLNSLTEDQVWYLGFHAADGSIITSSRKGYSRTFSYNVHPKDRDVLEKIIKIMDIKTNIYQYNNNQNNSFVKITFVSHENLLFFDNLDMKQKFPPLFLKEKYNRHYLRGLFDGDGRLHYRKRKGLMLIFINSEEEIVEKFSYSISKYLGITFKVPKYIEKDHIYRIQYESREARLLAWYLYHGPIVQYSLNRKRNEFYKLVTSYDEFEQFFQCFFGKTLKYSLKECNNGYYIPMSCGPNTDSLATCKILTNVGKKYNINIQPIFKNKGKWKYYVPYLKKEEAKKIDMLRPYIQ